MSTNEEKLQKLKVAELKELLAAHHLVQTGKKDELVKRLIENNISADGEAAAPAEEELLEPPTEENISAPEPTADSAAAPLKSAPSTAPTAPTETPAPAELTPEQQALKARAARFGLPFDPSASTRAAAPKSTNGSGSTSAPAVSTQPAEKKEKAGPIDKTSLGLSEEVLARRAAKFGLPEKKANAQEQKPKQNGAGGKEAKGKGPSAEALKVADPEITPEMAEKIAAEEEKRRKRAEKFGTAASTTTAGTSGAGEKHAADDSSAEPDAKKAKV